MRATFFRPSALDGIRALTTPWFPVAEIFLGFFPSPPPFFLYKDGTNFPPLGLDQCHRQKIEFVG